MPYSSVSTGTRTAIVGSSREREAAASIATYRYLRLGMVIIVVALGASLAIEAQQVRCLRGSISAYYYSPSSSIFVGGMVAIGVALIVIKGNTVVEDLLLNLAGMLAPIVALVPTTPADPCVRGPNPLPKNSDPLSDAVMRGAENNVKALLVAGTLALFAGVVVLAIDQWPRTRTRAATKYVGSRLLLLVVTGAVLAYGWVLFDSGEMLKKHGKSAFWMFVFLGVASIWNGIWLILVNRGDPTPTSKRWRAFSGCYITIGLLMGALGLFILWGPMESWYHKTLILEATEITLFAAMWMVQSIERWGDVTVPPPPTPGPGATVGVP